MQSVLLRIKSQGIKLPRVSLSYSFDLKTQFNLQGGGGSTASPDVDHEIVLLQLSVVQ